MLKRWYDRVGLCANSGQKHTTSNVLYHSHQLGRLRVRIMGHREIHVEHANLSNIYEVKQLYTEEMTYISGYATMTS